MGGCSADGHLKNSFAVHCNVSCVRREKSAQGVQKAQHEGVGRKGQRCDADPPPISPTKPYDKTFKYTGSSCTLLSCPVRKVGAIDLSTTEGWIDPYSVYRISNSHVTYSHLGGPTTTIAPPTRHDAPDREEKLSYSCKINVLYRVALANRILYRYYMYMQNARGGPDMNLHERCLKSSI